MTRKSKRWWSRSSNVPLPTDWMAAIVWMCVPGVVFSVAPGMPMEDRMPESLAPHVLLGRWEKLPHPLCAHRYPDMLQFQEGGLYVGRSDPPGTFTLWDAGTFELVDPHHIRLSTANDALITYDVSWQQDRLSFVDAEGCAFAYRKMT